MWLWTAAWLGAVGPSGCDDASSKSADEAKAETKDDAKAETKDDAKAETKDDAKAETKDDAKAETKDDAKAETKDDAKAEPEAAAAVAPLPATVLASITASRLREHVERLASDEMRGRDTPSAELDLAADYLRAELKAYGLQQAPGAPGYQQRFDCGGRGSSGRASNVLGLLPGRDPALSKQTVMLTAHYDHIGVDTYGGADPIFNGANDNASGTATMLVIAEALAAAPTPPRRSVLFVAFCGEEKGFVGSYHYASNPVRPLDDTVAMVNLEMLGRPGPEPTPRPWVTGMLRSDLGQWLTDANAGTPIRFIDGLEIGREEGNAFDRSDNYPVALEGVVAHSISVGKIDHYYHAPDDEAATLDYERMATLAHALARGVHRLAEHDDRPKWSDPPR